MFKRHPDIMNHLKPLINTRWARPLISPLIYTRSNVTSGQSCTGLNNLSTFGRAKKGKTESRGTKKKSGSYFCCTGGSSTTPASTSGNIFLIMMLKSCEINLSVAPAQLQSKPYLRPNLFFKHLIEYPSDVYMLQVEWWEPLPASGWLLLSSRGHGCIYGHDAWSKKKQKTMIDLLSDVH